MLDVVKQYKKAIVAALGVIVSAFVAAMLGDGVINVNEWANVVILGAGALSVGIAPNVPGAKYTKLLLSAVSAAATVFLSVFTGGLTSPEFWQIVVAALTALGVYRVPNQGDFLDRNFNANVALQ